MMGSLHRTFSNLFYRCQRLKTSSQTENAYTKEEPRYHTIFEMVMAGSATVLPISIYIISGHIADDITGPSGILSILIAALASGLAGLSYSELRARVHRLQASAYEYIYRIAGEAAAFTIGWLLILHHLLCSSAIARAISNNLDYLLDNRISNWTMDTIGDVPQVASYLDFVAFFLCLLAMLATVMDQQITDKRMKVVFLATTISILLFALLVSISHLDFHHWQKVNNFFPKGIGGLMGGATVLTYAFWGSEAILRSCDLNSRGLRRPAMTSILTVHIFNLVVLTLQISAITLLTSSWESQSPFPEAFTQAGLPWVRYIVCSTAIIVLFPVLLSQLNQSVKSVCLMATDGLLPLIFAKHSNQTEFPIISVLLIGIISSLCALVLPVSSLLQVFVLPIVLLQITVCIITMCFHYKPEQDVVPERRKRKVRKLNTNGHVHSSGAALGDGSIYGSTVAAVEPEESPHASTSATVEQLRTTNQTEANNNNNTGDPNGSSDDTDIDDIVEEYHQVRRMRQITDNASPADYRSRSTAGSYKRARVALCGFLISAITLGLLLTKATVLLKSNVFIIILLTVTIILMVVSAVVIGCLPRDTIQPYLVMIYVHHVPWIPLIALFLNILILCGTAPWAAGTVLLWIVLGCLIYLCFGMRHSHESDVPDHIPAEHRGLIYQSSATLPQGPMHVSLETDHPEHNDSTHDDVLLIDCT